MTDQTDPLFDWAFWLQWIVVTTVGWILGTLLIHPFGLAASGMAMGVLQWVVLQHHMATGRQWVLASIAGWTAGWLIALVVVPSESRILAGIVLGASVGVGQWVVLRREVRWAGWWLIASPLAWATGLGLIPGLLTSAVIPGSMTGMVLGVLLQHGRR